MASAAVMFLIGAVPISAASIDLTLVAFGEISTEALVLRSAADGPAPTRSASAGVRECGADATRRSEMRFVPKAVPLHATSARIPYDIGGDMSEPDGRAFELLELRLFSVVSLGLGDIGLEDDEPGESRTAGDVRKPLSERIAATSDRWRPAG